MMKHSIHHPITRRRGSLVLIALVCLIVGMSVLVSSAHRALLVQRQTERFTALRQCQWLLDAGINRAVVAIQNDAEYDGESWQLDQPLPGRRTGRVTIAVQASESAKGSSRIQVTAVVETRNSPVGRGQIRRSHSFHLPVSDNHAQDSQ
ncbi:hypothetical protein [Crateriforma conspicua]|uniref:Uncharacterized protein n=1 Tax=Crateriforma conspicua TaxID=2527996 RepID=A0A5C5Y3Q5_9PLAN|nr:hypothetical protein [Crateriforma conspicua]QDV64176.1 hypothetical protein Mal65_33260 [Crateriforma conspicua]TWT69568.1 hypothetical protein Pan14r_18560 [Crateriforma conspicua]